MIKNVIKGDIFKVILFVVLSSALLYFNPLYCAIFLFVLYLFSSYKKFSLFNLGIEREKKFYLLISFLIILNLFFVSYFLPEKNTLYFVSICFIYIITSTILTVKFGKFLEEKCILCKKFSLLEKMQFAVLLLNFIILFFIFVFILNNAFADFGLFGVLGQCLFFTSIIGLLWIYRKKYDILISIPIVLTTLLLIIHFIVFSFCI